MTIAITDANIFIDLIKLGILPYLFDIQLDIHTTSLVILECNREQRIQIRYFVNSEQLTITDVPDNEFENLRKLNGRQGLAEADLSVIYVSQNFKDCTILTGDKKVRQWCQKNNQSLHGILWLLETFIFHDHIDFDAGLNILQRLRIINPRLPEAICSKCQEAWSREELTLEDTLPQKR